DVRARRYVVARPLHAHARAERLHLEPELGEHVEQEPVLFEAVTAASVRNQLLEQAIDVELDGPIEQHVEVLEWNRLRMGRGDGVQRCERGRARTAVTNACEIGVEHPHSAGAGAGVFAPRIHLDAASTNTNNSAPMARAHSDESK